MVFVVVQSLSFVWFFVTPWTIACQTSLFLTISQSLLKFMSIESVMPSNHLILCHPLLLLPSVFPSIRVYSNKSALYIRWPKYGASASASVLPIIMQDWFPLELTDLIFFQSKGLSSVFSNTMKEEWDPNKTKRFLAGVGGLCQLQFKKRCVHSVFIAALCTIAKAWGNPNIHWWMN